MPFLRYFPAVIFLSRLALASGPPPSPLLDFSLNPEQIALVCRSAQVRAEADLALLEALAPESRNFENTIAAFENILSDYSDALKGAPFLAYVSSDSSVREAANECEAKAERFSIEVYGREGLYEAVKKAAGQKSELGEDAKLVEKILFDFRRNGLELKPPKRGRVQELKKKLVELELDFGKNIREYKDELELDPSRVAGLPEDFVKKLRRNDKGKYLVGLDYPEYFPFMENARDEAARRELEFKYNNRASTTNVAMFEEALELRREIAGLLGYQDYAHLTLEDRMAGKPEAVSAFLKRLEPSLKVKARKELLELLELKKKEDSSFPPLSPKLHPPTSTKQINNWDYRYFRNQLAKEKYALDHEKIKEYFPLDRVIDGMFVVYQKVLGLNFREDAESDRWHPDVKLFAVEDAHSGQVAGYFYMDLFPREGKYKHAAAFPLVQGRRLAAGAPASAGSASPPADRRTRSSAEGAGALRHTQDSPSGVYRKPVSAIVANLSKPAPDRPSLLKHDEVETLFHEFGHIMHQVLTRAKWARFAGTAVSLDFVEAPSQMFENWVWNEEALRALSGHYTDPTRKLPDETLRAMIAAKNMDSGLRYLRQVFFAQYDMTCHTRPKKDSTELYSRLIKDVGLIPMTPGTHPQASFGHLMGGYESGYYGYLWSEVYSADMFSRFEGEGVFSPNVGDEFRRDILEPGRGLDEKEQLKKFLGREPNEAAFFRSLGIGK